MDLQGVDRSVVVNPLVGLGVVILAGTGLAFAVASVPVRAAVVQSTLPAVVGLALVAYGIRIDADLSGSARRTIIVWIGIGLVAFFLVGFWFGTVSRLFETSFMLAVFGSLAAGSALGCTIGLYAARLHRANERLAEKNERLSDFAAIVSHDLRNPLSVASGQLELLDADEERVAAIGRSLERIETIIEQVLTLTRDVEDGTDDQPVSLAAIARRAWETVDTGDATLSVAADTRLVADPDLLVELLENLFRNAVEHGGPDVTVTVGECEAGFYVADDGPGIPPEDREDAFTREFSTGSGTGMGLVIVSRIAEAHGWEVSVGESDDGGARFVVSV
jgi:signal transduction histidine kinase